MNDYIKLIIFNLVIIFLSFKFKKNIMIFYAFLMLIMLTYKMMLKNKLIEGNFQEDLYKSLDNLDYNRPTLELPLDKMTLIMEKILEKIKGEEKFKKGKECKGEFVIKKLTNKTCGDGFNERVYKIIDKGDGDCLHSELYKEKVPLRPCGYAEKCEKDLDCESNKCNDGFCDFELDCSETMLSGCGYDSCLALNDGLDKDLYYWSDNKCNVNPCNENTYQMCDEGGCNDLSYRFKYDTEKKQCKEIVNKQGESNTEPSSMAKIYQEYVDEGGYDNVCNPDSDKETCEVGADLQPRYYCKEGYVKDNDGIDGDSNHCISCQYPDEVTDPSSINNACLEASGNTQQQIQDYCNSSPGDVNILVNDISNNSNCSPKSISYNCVTGGYCDDIDDSSDAGGSGASGDSSGVVPNQPTAQVGETCAGISRNDDERLEISGNYCTNPTARTGNYAYTIFEPSAAQDHTSPCSDREMQCESHCTSTGYGVNPEYTPRTSFCKSCCVQGPASGGSTDPIQTTSVADKSEILGRSSQSDTNTCLPTTPCMSWSDRTSGGGLVCPGACVLPPDMINSDCARDWGDLDGVRTFCEDSCALVSQDEFASQFFSDDSCHKCCGN